MNVAVLYNKPTHRFTEDATHKAAELDTELSAYEVYDALKSKGVRAQLVPVTQDSISEIIGSIHTGDLVFNLIEWTGRDTPLVRQVFDALSACRLAYTGATLENYLNTCDKMITKRLCRKYGLPTADWQEFINGHEPITISSYPVIVKVSREHSSVGISSDSVAHSAGELKRIVNARLTAFQQPVYAETFLSGREFQVTLLEKERGLTVLPPAEIVYTKGTHVPLLTYESRWDEKHTDYDNSVVVLAGLTDSLHKTLDALCGKAFRTLGFRDYARFDIRCDEKDNPYFLELNSNPGLGDDDEYGMTLSYKAAGLTFADFIWEIVQSALRRQTKAKL